MNKIIFFGTSEFSAKILKHLIQTKKIIKAIVTQPDRALKRSKKLTPLPVKEEASEICPDILLLQPEKASDKGFIDSIAELEPDLFIVVAYGQILKKSLLNVPKLGSINIHASLLPKYRGAAPIQRAIMNNEQKTGITIMKMNEKMDAGEMILKKDCTIKINDTFKDVENRLINISCSLIDQVVRDYEKGIFLSTAQNHNMATFAEKINSQDCQINWDQSALKIHNIIRALSPRPGAVSYVKIGEELIKVKIILSEIITSNGAAGTVIQKKPLIVACRENGLVIKKIQPEGRKIMDANSWINGLKEKDFTFT
jgi:methionyl-tRNA formyltransferase